MNESNRDRIGSYPTCEASLPTVSSLRSIYILNLGLFLGKVTQKFVLCP